MMRLHCRGIFRRVDGVGIGLVRRLIGELGKRRLRVGGEMLVLRHSEVLWRDSGRV